MAVKSTHLPVLLSLLKCLRTGDKLLFQFSFYLEQTGLRTSLCISLHVNICIAVCACMFKCSYYIFNTGARVQGNTILSGALVCRGVSVPQLSCQLLHIRITYTVIMHCA